MVRTAAAKKKQQAHPAPQHARHSRRPQYGVEPREGAAREVVKPGRPVAERPSDRPVSRGVVGRVELRTRVEPARVEVAAKKVRERSAERGVQRSGR